jgi:hypothetical protein
MLPPDWASFDFRYTLDLPRLVPHLVALEAYRDAAAVQAVPPIWVDPPPSAGEHRTPSAGAWAWVKTRFDPGGAPLSITDILAMHRLVGQQSGLEPASCGVFRTAPVRVGRPSVGGLHEGAPADQLPLLMERYVAFIDAVPARALPPVIAALLAHFFLSAIHPFMDGNGRTSRLMAAAILWQRGFRLHGGHALERHFYHHQLRYHTLLHRSWQRCPFEVTAFIAFGIEGVIAELRSVDAFLRVKRNRVCEGDAVTHRRAPRVSRVSVPRGNLGRGVSLLAVALLSPSSGLAANANVFADVATGDSVAGNEDFALTVDPGAVTVIAGGETKFTVSFQSVGGFAGWIRPQTLGIEGAQGAVGSWSIPTVKVSAGGTTKATFTILTLLDTPLGEYPIIFQGVNGSVTHRSGPVTLRVTGPPQNAISAAFHPGAPVVGATNCAISGNATAGGWVKDVSTFPDGSVHSFSSKANGVGSYTDGPFVLKQLGTYHDVLIDTATGGQTEVVYRGVGDFAATIEEPKRTIVSGRAVEFVVTFSSLSGFAGVVTPTVENTSELANVNVTWSPAAVPVSPGAPGKSRLTVMATTAKSAATLTIRVKGTNGSVAHVAPDIVLRVVPI